MSPSGLTLICWPFHNGLPGVGMGAGAEVLAGDAELRAGIEAAGWRLGDDSVAPVADSEAEIARVIELVRRLAGRVRLAVERDAFPLVLAGNCNSCLGTVAGAGPGELGAVWFDAHADFDDPEDNTDGFFDVMGLAMLTGRGWSALRATIPGHVPIAERAVVLAGVRDLEPHQRRRLDASAVRAVPGAIDPEAFADALAGLGGEVSRVYLHVDLDSLDPAEATANAYAAPGGPTLERLLACIDLVCARFTVAAAAVTAYDPSLDADGRTLRAARAVVAAIARGVRPEGSGGGAGGSA